MTILQILRWIDKHFEEVMLVGITAIMTVCLFFQVVSRYALKFPLAWTEEISVNLLVWLCYFGASLAVKQRKHLRIDLLITFMKPRMRSVFDIISSTCFFAFAAFVLWQLTNLTLNIYKRGQITAVLMVPSWIIYFGAWLAFAFTVIRLVQDILRSVKELRAPADPAPAAEDLSKEAAK